MNKLENRLRESLRSAGRSFSPSGAHVMEPKRFLRTRRRRVLLRGAGALALVTALVAVVVVAAPTDRALDRPTPVGPVPAPEGPMEITTRIDVGPRPLGVAADEEHVFVGHSEVEDIEVVDPQTHEVVDAYGYGIADTYPAPQRVAVGPEALYVGRNGLVEARNPDTGEVVADTNPNVDVLGTISDIVYGDGFVWVATECCTGVDRNSILQLSAEDLSLVGTYKGAEITREFPTYPNLDYGYGALWVSTNGGKADGLVRIDPGTERVEKVPGVTSASDVAVGAGGVWVYENTSQAGNARLMRLDPNTLKIEDVTSLSGYFAWLEADDNGVWVLNAADETNRALLRIDPLSMRPIAGDVPLGAGPFEMTSGFDSIWITDEGKAELIRVDVATETAEE